MLRHGRPGMSHGYSSAQNVPFQRTWWNVRYDTRSGDRRRRRGARWVALHSKLGDEPTGNLDAKSGAESMGCSRSFADKTAPSS